MTDDDRRGMLERAWDEAAVEYEHYFVPRFAPWVATAVRAVSDSALPRGPILVPCCGTFPELPALVAAHPAREIVGIDLSAEMVRIARERADGHPGVRVVQGDAAVLGPDWAGRCAGVVSVFGLQQLPDPAFAIGEWVTALRPGGCLSVVFWPTSTEEDGPFALLDRVLDRHGPAGTADSWERRLADAVTVAGAILDWDEDVGHPIEHPDADAFWSAITSGGSLRALAIARGEAFMSARREEFLELAPAGPWRHLPRARWIVAHRPAE